MGRGILSGLSIQHVKGIWALIVFVAVTLIPVLGVFSDAINFLSNAIIRHGLMTAANGTVIEKGVYALVPWMIVTLIAIAIYALSVTILLFSISRTSSTHIFPENISPITSKQNSLMNDADAQNLRRQLDSQLSYMKTLYTYVLQEINLPFRNVTAVKGYYHVGQEGDISVHLVVTISANDKPVWFWRYYIHGDEWTKGAKFFSDIIFNIDSIESGTDVISFPVEDSPIKKTFVLYLFPAVEPFHSRTLRISYKWPGFLAGLAKTGKTNFFWKYEQSGQKGLDQFHAEFSFHESYGDIRCEVTGAWVPQMRLVENKINHGNGWIYSGTNMTGQNDSLELTFYSTPPKLS